MEHSAWHRNCVNSSSFSVSTSTALAPLSATLPHHSVWSKSSHVSDQYLVAGDKLGL